MPVMFDLKDAKDFYQATGVGFLNNGVFVRLTKDGQQPVFKPIKNGAIEISENDPFWIPLPAWLIGYDI